MLYDYFRNGINLGGWLSQYNCLPTPPKTSEQETAHFAAFITEKNIKQIASWGLDHVRLPVDHRFLENPQDPFAIRGEALRCIDLCADWCDKYHLNLIIDLHHAQGNVWGMMDEPMPLLTEKRCRNRFINIWEQLTRHFLGRSSPVVMFELLNEVSDGSGYLWNTLCKEALRHIRNIDADRLILIGSNGQNSAFCLKELELIDDPGVFYNFHFYDPQVFTHQKAHFSEEMKEFNQTVTYPGDISSFLPYLLERRQYLPKYSRVATELRNDRELMIRLLKDAADFVKYSGHELYCGEFGVIDSAPDKDAVAWIQDCIDFFDEHQIGHALWNYKELDFGFVDENDNVISQERVEALFQNYKAENGGTAKKQ